MSDAAASSTASELAVRLRREECPGYMCERVNPDHVNNESVDPRVNGGEGTCCVCGADTRSWCKGCHHYFCYHMSKSRKKLSKATTNEDNLVIMESCQPEKEYVEMGYEEIMVKKRKVIRKVVVNRPCYIMGHPRWADATVEIESDVPAPMSLHQSGRL